jgi:hypothetical protein
VPTKNPLLLHKLILAGHREYALPYHVGSHCPARDAPNFASYPSELQLEHLVLRHQLQVLSHTGGGFEAVL